MSDESILCIDILLSFFRLNDVPRLFMAANCAFFGCMEKYDTKN